MKIKILSLAICILSILNVFADGFTPPATSSSQIIAAGGAIVAGTNNFTGPNSFTKPIFAPNVVSNLNQVKFSNTNCVYVLPYGNDSSPIYGIIYKTLGAALTNNPKNSTIFLGGTINYLNDFTTFLTNVAIVGLYPTPYLVNGTTNRSTSINVGAYVSMVNIIMTNVVIFPSILAHDCLFQDLNFQNQQSFDVFYPSIMTNCFFLNIETHSAWDNLCKVMHSQIIGCRLYTDTAQPALGTIDGDGNLIKDCRLSFIQRDAADFGGANVIESLIGVGNEIDNCFIFGQSDSPSDGQIGPTDGIGNGFGTLEGFTNVIGGFTFDNGTNATLNIFYSQKFAALNGGSFSGSFNSTGTNTFTMGGTGYTNVNAFDVRIFELQGTSLVFTNLTSKFGFSLGTLSVNNDFMLLHTNECVIGTGVTGKILQ